MKEPKQETLEEAASLAKEEYPVWLDEEVFILGAKWMQERMYSEEEVLAMLSNYDNHIQENFDPSKTILPIKEWFEQFKKK